MKRISLTILFCTSILIFGCRNDRDTSEEVEDLEAFDPEMTEEDEMVQNTIRVEIESKSNSDVTGNAVFTEEDGQVTMVATVDGLEEGLHAIHLHENADCSADDASSAGGHWNPTFEKHGEWGDPEGYHRGDIGNFEVDSDGTGTVTMTTDQWCIGCDDETKNIVGTALLVHEGVDDFVSQPAGDAGARVGCGELDEVVEE